MLRMRLWEHSPINNMSCKNNGRQNWRPLFLYGTIYVFILPAYTQKALWKTLFFSTSGPLGPEIAQTRPSGSLKPYISINFDTTRAGIWQKSPERYELERIVVRLSTMPGIYGRRALHQGVWKLSLKACTPLMLLAERCFSIKTAFSWRNAVSLKGFSIKTAFSWRNASFWSKLLSFYDKA